MSIATTRPRRCDPGTDSVTHSASLPNMCPMSGNPLSGSTLSVTYSPSDGRVIDVDLLHAEIRSYVGGRDDVREMERVIQRLADWCATQCVNPYVVGRLVISVDGGTQEMIVRCRR